MEFLNTCINLLQANLLSVPFLMFILGFLSHIFKHEIRIPGEVYKGISMYLLFTIGFKGGIALQQSVPSTFLSLSFASLSAGIIIPLWIYIICRLVIGLSRNDSGAMAAHYGSVSAVTYITAVKLLETKGCVTNGSFPIILTIMEVTGILTGLSLASRDKGLSPLAILWQVTTSQSILLLLGGLFVGALAHHESIQATTPLFNDLFYSILGFFLLDMGVAAAQRLSHFQQLGIRLVLFAIVAPISNGLIGLCLAKFLAFDICTSTIFATLCASASYIAAPAAVRHTLPHANPGYYLTCSMAITFPFNLALGIPLYYYLSCHIL